jgi:hypothetical protein
MSYATTFIEVGWADEFEPSNTVSIDALRADTEWATA